MNKRDRKVARLTRRFRLIDDYRQTCRDEIARMKAHNQHLASNDDRYTAEDFRRSLRKLRHDFTRGIAGRKAA